MSSPFEASARPVDVHILHVFCDPNGIGGNRVAVVHGDPPIPRGERQELARSLGVGKTVFVDQPLSGEVEIYTPDGQLPFAGYPLIGVAWFLSTLDNRLKSVGTNASRADVSFDGSITWIGFVPHRKFDVQLRQFATPEEVESFGGLDGPADCYGWAWIDESSGTVRGRMATAAGFDDLSDPTPGIPTEVLTLRLGRDLHIHHHLQSHIFTRISGGGKFWLGGYVTSAQ